MYFISCYQTCISCNTIIIIKNGTYYDGKFVRQFRKYILFETKNKEQRRHTNATL